MNLIELRGEPMLLAAAERCQIELQRIAEVGTADRFLCLCEQQCRAGGDGSPQAILEHLQTTLRALEASKLELKYADFQPAHA